MMLKIRKTQFNNNSKLLFTLVAVVISLINYSFSPPNLDEHKENEPPSISKKRPKNSFHPDSLKGEELEKYKKWKAELNENDFKFSHLNDSLPFKNYSIENPERSYANGKIVGNWKRKYFRQLGENQNGYRVLSSAYDKGNDIFYAVTSTGSLFKLHKDTENQWELRNNKINFSKCALSGFNLPNGSFRLLKQNSNGPMMYSDNEGINWLNADGALFENNWNYTTLITDYNNSKRIIAFGSNFSNSKAYYRIYYSYDFGLTYKESSFNNWTHDNYTVKIERIYNTNNIAAFVHNKTSKTIEIYTLNETDNDFKLISQTNQAFDELTSFKACYADNNIHYYINDGIKKIYYSGDSGASWKLTNSENKARVIEAVHPNKPNIVYRGFVDLFMSTDYGATWKTNKHRLKTFYFWDVEHMRFYKKQNGQYTSFVGTHFGCFYSNEADNWQSWKTLNNGCPSMMIYDATFSEINNIGYAALQDRGVHGYVDDDEDYQHNIQEVANADLMRVTLAKNESSIWYWYYYGTIGRSDVTINAAPANASKKNYFGRWWTSNMVASPDKSEDAVYIAAAKQLQKFSFNGDTIARTFHPYTFPEEVVGFNYSKLNTNLWYTCQKNGQFFYSTDGGKTFTKTNFEGTWPKQQNGVNRCRQVIKASPKDENTVYFAGLGNQFLISKDGGKTFTSHINGLNVGRFRDFDISPNGKYIFAACAYSGIWIFSVDENYWYEMNDDSIDVADYTTCQFISSKNLIRFTSYGGGITDLVLTKKSIKHTTK